MYYTDEIMVTQHIKTHTYHFYNNGFLLMWEYLRLFFGLVPLRPPAHTAFIWHACENVCVCVCM